MIVTLVEFFLNAEGQQRFPDWVHRLGAFASTYEGFLDVRQMTPADEPNRSLFMLTFDTTEHTQRWMVSPERQELLGPILPFWIQESQITHYRAGQPWSESA
jgi:antibiotic biosynthesis monooxygenase (ABM) superfamily enzyme